jgi:hypothetical protein
MFPRRQHTTVVCRGGDLNKYHGRAGDGLQRPLVPRSRFQQQLMPGVAMTSHVKRGPQLFDVFMMWFALRASEEPEPVNCDG